MKIRIAIVCALAIALLSFSLTGKGSRNQKSHTKKSASNETKVNRGLAMEDKNQFN